MRPVCKPNIQREFDRAYAKVHQKRGWALSGQVKSNSCSVVLSGLGREKAQHRLLRSEVLREL